MSIFEKKISEGINQFIEECSFSLIENYSNYSQKIMIPLLYMFKFLSDKWPDTGRSVRTLKKDILELLVLLLLSDKQSKDITSILEKTAIKLEKSWTFKLSDFPFLTESQEREILDLIYLSDKIESIEHEFSILDFRKVISKNKFLKADPEFIDKLNEQYDISRKNFGKYEPQDEFFLKNLFTSVVKEELAERYPGSMILLPLRCLLKEIEAINIRVSDPCSESPEMPELISFSVPNDCYIYKKLFIKNSVGQYSSVPDWAAWLFHAGEKMATIRQQKKNIVLGLSLPTRAYAALFFLLGYETWNARQYFLNGHDESEYFNTIIQKKKNTPLLIWEKERWKRCFSSGIKIVNNQKMFVANVPGTDNKKHDIFIPKGQIFRIREAVDPEREVGEHQLGFSMRGFGFLRRYYEKNESSILNYLISNKPGFALVGNKTLLKNEGERLAVSMKIMEKRKEKWLSGSLLDILRIDPFLLSEFDLARGTILSHESVNEYNVHPGLIVFDGSSSFLNHFDDLDADIKVVIFDRSESRFLEAARVMLDQHYSDRENEEDMLFCDKLPETVEALMFEE